MNDDEEGTIMTVGERLRAAREAAGMSLEDVATVTRIPTRHLASLETSDFSRLPAPTYSIGFAKNYAGAVGLDRAEIGEQLRAELGGSRPSQHQAETFEPIDPARTMPRWVLVAAIAAILVVVLAATWLNRRAQEAPDDVATVEEPAAPAASPAPTAVAAGAVVITATAEAWVSIRDGANVLQEGILQAGQSFTVPPTASAPTLTTAKAEALRIAVGDRVAPPVGPPATRVSNVSLKPADLLRPPAAAPPAAAPPAASPAPAPPRTVARPAPAPVQRPVVRPPTPTPAPAPASNTTDSPQPA